MRTALSTLLFSVLLLGIVAQSDARAKEDSITVETFIVPDSSRITGESPTLLDIERRLDKLEREVVSQQVAVGFFSSVLNTQTAIFTVIMVAVIAVAGLLTFYRVKTLVKEEADRSRVEFTNWQKIQL